MSKSTLIRTNGPMPPGGFSFQDPITGKGYRDLSTLFDDRVRQIINDRNANRRLISSPRQLDPLVIGEQLSHQVCERLKGDSKWCVGGAIPQKFLHQSAPEAPLEIIKDKPCKFCGVMALSEIICTPCNGRVIGYKCNSCGKMNPK